MDLDQLVDQGEDIVYDDKADAQYTARENMIERHTARIKEIAQMLNNLSRKEQKTTKEVALINLLARTLAEYQALLMEVYLSR